MSAVEQFGQYLAGLSEESLRRSGTIICRIRSLVNSDSWEEAEAELVASDALTSSPPWLHPVCDDELTAMRVLAERWRACEGKERDLAKSQALIRQRAAEHAEEQARRDAAERRAMDERAALESREAMERAAEAERLRRADEVRVDGSAVSDTIGVDGVVGKDGDDSGAATGDGDGDGGRVDKARVAEAWAAANAAVGGVFGSTSIASVVIRAPRMSTAPQFPAAPLPLSVDEPYDVRYIRVQLRRRQVRLKLLETPLSPIGRLQVAFVHPGTWWLVLCVARAVCVACVACVVRVVFVVCVVLAPNDYMVR